MATNDEVGGDGMELDTDCEEEATVMAMNPATKCLSIGSRGYHTWMNLRKGENGGEYQICSNPACATVREADEKGRTIPGTFRAS